MSRDLDAHIAELLGIRVSSHPRYAGDGADVQLVEVPQFSTDIAAAWTLVEYMRARGWIYTLGDDDEEDHGTGKHFAGFYRDGSGLREATAETAPLAIARALVAAMGGTV